jgi:hypothetical protein
MTATAIPTHYAGCYFRSRLEARWAVVFDTLGIRWEYEREGYALPSGWYLPDFWLPDAEFWVEIKPLNIEIDQRWGELVDATNYAMFVFYGTPGMSPTRGFITKGTTAGTIYDFSQDTSYPMCIQGIGAATKNPAILSAYEAARSARFDHGQSGAGA